MSPPDAPRWLVCIAAPKEAEAALRRRSPVRAPSIWEPLDLPDAEVVLTGVGKASAAAAAARFYDPARHAGVLSIGIAGALPGSGLEPGECVLALPSLFSDEGSVTPRGFLSLDAMGFGADAPPSLPDDRSRDALSPLVERVEPVATVSVCSGTDAWASDTARRTGAAAEAMEGAAVALAVRRVNPDARFAELRVISNTTGDRRRQVWDLERAFDRLADLFPGALAALIAR